MKFGCKCAKRFNLPRNHVCRERPFPCQEYGGAVLLFPTSEISIPTTTTPNTLLRFQCGNHTSFRTVDPGHAEMSRLQGCPYSIAPSNRRHSCFITNLGSPVNGVLPWFYYCPVIAPQQREDPPIIHWISPSPHRPSIINESLYPRSLTLLRRHYRLP